MNWRLFVSIRYLASKRKERFISVISLLSILGVALGVAALIVVISVMSGFDNDFQQKIIGTNAHIVIDSPYGIKVDPEFRNTLMSVPHVAGASFFLSGQALVRKDEQVTGVILRGIDPDGEMTVTKIDDYIKEGDIRFRKGDVVIGIELARKLGVDIGDGLRLVTSSCVDGRNFKVRGIFASGMYDYDSNLIYTSIADGQDLLALVGTASGIAIKVDDMSNVTKVKKSFQDMVSPPTVVRTWMDANKNFLTAIKLEKTVMFIILTLIVMVACFNIASALIMTVLEKTKDIGILKALGASRFDIMAVFALQGAMTGVMGTALGALTGIALCWILKTYKFITLPSDIYYIDKLPIRMEAGDVAVIILSSLAISFLATLYPSYKAARLDPVEALRYE